MNFEGKSPKNFRLSKVVIRQVGRRVCQENPPFFLASSGTGKWTQGNLFKTIYIFVDKNTHNGRHHYAFISRGQPLLIA